MQLSVEEDRQGIYWGLRRHFDSVCCPIPVASKRSRPMREGPGRVLRGTACNNLPVADDCYILGGGT